MSIHSTGGMPNPMTTKEDLIKGGTGGKPQRLAKGIEGKALGILSGVLAWITAGVSNFLGLSDTPSAYTDQAGKLLLVNAEEDALEFGGSPVIGDNVPLYFDNAKSLGLKYSINHDTLLISSDLAWVGSVYFYGNTGIDGGGSWEPTLTFYSRGEVRLTNVAQGGPFDKYFFIDMDNGIRLRTGGANVLAKLLADNIAGSDKTFQFPNASGTLALQGLAGTRIYYVSDTSGGSPTRKLTFSWGILTTDT